MSKISIAALLVAAWAIAAPAYAQDVSASAEISASAEVSTAPSVDPGTSSEVSVEPSGEVSTQPSSEGGGTKVDVDSSININVTVQQTVEIRNYVIQLNVQPVTVDFDIVLGATVPSTVVLTPLPAQIIQLVPGFEGYLFFLLPDGRIIIVSPTTLKIVVILYA
ncbi:MAG: DUF1236 domain-containing protein [Hyphomicrobiales bacterium]|nr:MAG: DUF1236 domain-containing protein [Hyphomicrobiales bacterium]